MERAKFRAGKGADGGVGRAEGGKWIPGPGGAVAGPEARNDGDCEERCPTRGPIRPSGAEEAGERLPGELLLNFPEFTDHERPKNLLDVGRHGVRSVLSTPPR